MEATEITKVIDGVYKNILENFNPSSRQMISTGKAYLKSLHGASAASSLYLDTLVRLSRQAQASTLGNSGDIGTSLIQITEVFKEIHAQQLNTLKAFYVDFLVPLETNLEKDTRVIQTEQKKFLMCHKQRMESYNKAASTVKKMRKKSRKSNASAAALDKEIKVMQNLEEERSKLEAFCDKSIKDALTQERRRYGFILERQASLAKHYLAFYAKGNSLLNVKLENWMKIAKTRETLPESMQNALLKRIQGGDEEECIYCSPRRPGAACDDTCSISSQLRKTKSMDAGEIINLQSEQSELTVASSAGTMSRAKSEINLMMNGPSGNGTGDRERSATSGFSYDNHDGARDAGIVQRPKSLAVATETTNSGFAKALYAYLSSGENQLSFLEGDIISLIGDRNKGWQFGENLRTQKTGWFPVAYTEMDVSISHMEMSKSSTMPLSSSTNGTTPTMTSTGTGSSPVPPPMTVPLPPSVLNMNNINSQQSMSRMTMSGGHGTYSPTSSSNSSSSTFHQKRLNADVIVHRTPDSILMSNPSTPSANKSITSPVTPLGPGGVNSNNNLIAPSSRGVNTSARHGPAPACTSDSLHSSNDSGISNDLNTANAGGRGAGPPPQPDVDYSDDDVSHLVNRQKEMERAAAQSGDKWLMERYVTSESIRIGGLGIAGITRRRSLSFSNVSGVGVGNQLRPGSRPSNDFLSSGYSPYQGRHSGLIRRPTEPVSTQHRRSHHNDNRSSSFDQGGPLKKFLNRTKSLIWKRQTLDPIDSISAAGSTGSLELWGSHISLVDANYDSFEMKELCSSKPRHHYDDDDTIKDENVNAEDNQLPPPLPSLPTSPNLRGTTGGGKSHGNGSKEKSAGIKNSKSMTSSNSNSHNNTAKAVPPPLPPFPANLANLRGFSNPNNQHNNMKNHSPNSSNHKATSTSDSLNNLSITNSNSPLPPLGLDDRDNVDGGSTIGPRDSDSCIFISDHMKQKGSQRSGRKSTKSSVGTDRLSKKIQTALLDDDYDHHNGGPDSGIVLSKKGHQVSRIESFSEYEAPIVPSVKSSKKKTTSSSAPRSTSQAQPHHNGHNGHHNGNAMNGNDMNIVNRKKFKNKRNVTKMGLVATGSSEIKNMNIGGSRGQLSRSHIMATAEEKARKFSYNSDDEDVVDEYDVDEDVIDFDDEEDPYTVNENDLDNTSSVFMEGETVEEEPVDDHHNHEEVHGHRSRSQGSHSLHRQQQQQQHQRQSQSQNQISREGRKEGKSKIVENGQSYRSSNGGGERKGKSSSKNGSSNVHHFNGENHYNHSSRFAPIDAYGDNGHVNGNGPTSTTVNGGVVVNGGGGGGKGRMNSPAPPPPPPNAVAVKSNGRNDHHRHQNNGNGDKGRGNGNGTTGSRRNHGGGGGPTTIKGSIRAEFHTVELIATTDANSNNNSRMDKPMADYASHIHKRLYFPERNSRLDQKSERTGNRYGAWYDLWEADASVPCK